MKKEYAKPELNTKAYAQFENVFTGCDQNPSQSNCDSSDDILINESKQCRQNNNKGSN